nr:penicillin-binding protein activator [Candidatus Enterousia merdequi]
MTNKFFIFLCILLAGCGANQSLKTTQMATYNPRNVQENYSSSIYGFDTTGVSANVAVLLPTTGSAQTTGNDIKTSIETAFLRQPNTNIKVTFYDVSGNQDERTSTIKTALSANPDIIIGPLFAEDAITVRNLKPFDTPVISFTSDINALGNNVMTMNLIPMQSIETIISQMQKDGAKNMIIFAPKDKSGELMTSVADKAAFLYDIPVNGVFYYESGNSDSIKDSTMRASMYNTRKAANTRAREVLSDILNKESLDEKTKASLINQLEKISRKDTLGKLPYDSILFLGNGEDSKTIASFLRYYGVDNRDAVFYGTTLWHGSDIASDFTLSGSKYATLPEISNNFVSLYNMVSGKDPDYLAAFGYDAANFALGIIHKKQFQNSYMFNPNGYIGTSGIFRIQPNGESERALRILELNGSETPITIKESASNFITVLYNVNMNDLDYIKEQELQTRGVNPGDYITIPENLRRKSAYKTKTIGANYKEETNERTLETPVQIYESGEQEIVSDPEYEPVKIENVSRKYIDSVEIEE